MKIKYKACALVAAAGALAVAVPAAAHPSGSSQQTGANHPTGSIHSPNPHACKAHKVAYIVSGTVNSSQAPNSITVNNGIVSGGTLLVDVVHTNRWARGDKGKVGALYDLGPSTKVKFDGGATDFVNPNRVKLIGREEVITNTRCGDAGPVGSPTFRMVVVHPAAS